MFNYKKSLGQHFLHDNNIIHKIIEALVLEKPEYVLEVGPGGGALTQHLLNGKFIFKTVEIDKEKIDFLKTQYNNLEIIEQDFLQIEKPYQSNFTVVGNFPYNISTQIVFKILEWLPNVNCVIGMFQKEVAKRIASKNNDKDFGILSVMAQTYYDIEYLFDVPAGCFTPPPKVTSGVIKMKIKETMPDVNYNKLLKFTKAAFNQRRKTLRNSLGSIISKDLLNDDFFTKRAEQLSVSEFIELTNKFM